MSFAEQLALGLAVAFTAAILTLLGNWLIQSAQSRGRVKAELREFVRSMHAETVATVADIDLFMREIRASVLVGAPVQRDADALRELINARWEEDLLRRLRQLRFGHPDPDVRLAAETLEDAMWPYVSAAGEASHGGGWFGPRPESERRNTLDYANHAMRQLRAAVWTSPRRDVPNGTYTGEDRPSYLARSMAGFNPDGSPKPARGDLE